VGRFLGGKVKKVEIGSGKTVFKFGFFEIRSLYFLRSMFLVSFDKLNKTKRILLYMGGILFNLLSAALLYELKSLSIIPDIKLINDVILLSIIYASLQMLPVTIYGADTDAKSLMNALKYNFFNELYEKKKDINAFEKEVDKEIERLRISVNKHNFEFMKVRYLSLVLYKASNLADFGLFEKAIDTINSIEGEISLLSPNMQLDCYNNMLYYHVLANKLVEAKTCYNRLMEHIDLASKDKKERKHIDDTIATYEYFIGNIEQSQGIFEDIIKLIENPDHRISTNYYLSQIYIKKERKFDAIKLLSEINITKARPYFQDLIFTAKSELGI
jgi:tetratricopeptide (TPR) repeat protein